MQKEQEIVIEKIINESQTQQQNVILEEKVALLKEKQPELIEKIKTICEEIITNTTIIYKKSFTLPFEVEDVEAYEEIFRENFNEMQQFENDDWNISIQKTNAISVTRNIYRTTSPIYVLNVALIPKITEPENQKIMQYNNFKK